jgi:hypothetical protein
MSLLAAVVGALIAADGGAPAPAAKSAPSLLAPRPALNREVREAYVLQPAKDRSGDLVYEGPRFTARVARDGSVTFGDRKIADFKWSLWPRRVTLNVPSLQSSLGGLIRGQGPPPPPMPDDRGPPPETTMLIPEVSRYRPDPREGCRECKNMGFTPLPMSVGARFDLSDEIARMNGTDPLRYEKAEFLVATRERRVGMAVKRHAANVHRATAELPAMLASIACDDRMSRADRLAILNALRDDMDLASAEGRDGAARITEAIARYFGPADGGSACPGPR